MTNPKCPSCDQPVVPYYSHCPDCGADLRIQCEACGSLFTRHQQRCPFCRPREETEPSPFANSPRSKRANRPQGGEQHGWLQMRRASTGY